MVYSSVGGAERNTGVPHYESKRRVEEYMGSLGFSATFVRPTFFMDNFANEFSTQDEDGALVVQMPLPGGVPLRMIAIEDIGKAATAALLDPDRVPEGRVEIAGDELTGEQEDRPARYEALPLEILADNPDLQAVFAWFADPPSLRADFAATRSPVPSVQDFATWLAGRN